MLRLLFVFCSIISIGNKRFEIYHALDSAYFYFPYQCWHPYKLNLLRTSYIQFEIYKVHVHWIVTRRKEMPTRSCRISNQYTMHRFIWKIKIWLWKCFLYVNFSYRLQVEMSLFPLANSLFKMSANRFFLSSNIYFFLTNIHSIEFNNSTLISIEKFDFLLPNHFKCTGKEIRKKMNHKSFPFRQSNVIP